MIYTSSLHPAIRRFFLNVKFYYQAFRRLELHNKAASLSYYTVISIFPMVLFFTALISDIVPPESVLPRISGMLDEMLPLHSELIMSNLTALFRHKVGFTWFGSISLIVTAQLLYVNMERIINRILHIPKKRSFILTRLFFFVWLACMVFILFTPLIFELLHVMIDSIGLRISYWATLSSKGGFILVSFLMFFVVMLILPAKRLPLKRVATGGLSFSLTLQLGKTIFKWVTLSHLDRYNLIYGSLSSIILGLLWIFYFYLMLLCFVYWVGRKFDPLYIEKRRPLA